MKTKLFIFDLDNTLHCASRHIFPEMNMRIRKYIETHIGLDETSALDLHQHCMKKYGATLMGLRKLYANQVNPFHFMDEVHDFPDLHQMLVFDKGMRQALQRLQGKKVIFSNAVQYYVENVLQHMHIRNLFDDIYTTERIKLHQKPHPYGYYKILSDYKVKPQQVVMVEDSVKNLQMAKKIGMKTVLISRSIKKNPCVDICLPSVIQLPNVIHLL